MSLDDLQGNAFIKADLDIVNVRQYGALPRVSVDEVADDTSGIQRAIDAISTIGGGAVYMPPGSYTITDTLTLPIGVCLHGEPVGLNTTRIKAAGMSDKVAIRITGHPNSLSGQMLVKDLVIHAEYGNLGTGLAISSHRASIQNVQIFGASSTDGALRIADCGGVVLNNVILSGFSALGTSGSGYGLVIENASGIVGHVAAAGFTCGAYLNGMRTSHLDLHTEVCNGTGVIATGNSRHNVIRTRYANCETRWLHLTGTSKHNVIYIWRESDVNVPSYPIVVDTDTAKNILFTDEMVLRNTWDVTVWGASLQLAELTVTGDISAAGGFKQPVSFMGRNVAAYDTGLALDVLGLPGSTEVVMPYAGSVIGISVASNEPRSGGTLMVSATVNDWTTGLQAQLDETNTQYHSATQAKDTDSFGAGDRLGAKVTTDGSWAPMTADIVVMVVVEM